MNTNKSIQQVVENLKRQVKDQIEISGNPLEDFRGEKFGLRDWKFKGVKA